MRAPSHVLGWALVGALAGSSVFLTGCGDSDDDNGGTPDASADVDAGGDTDPDVDPDVDPDTDTGPDPDTDTGPDPDTDTGPDTDVTPGLGNIIEVADGAETFTILLTALETAGLTETLEGDGPFTVFAPTDAAFEALLTELGITAEQLLASETLSQTLLYHVLVGVEVPSSAVTTGPVTTGAELTAWINTADGVVINEATVTTADVEASNGVIHIVDSVILPANIVELATYAGQFDTLLAAAVEAEVAGVLQTAGPFTVFAPTDDAFATLISELETTPEALLAREDLAQILTYHALFGDVRAADVTAGFFTTVSGLSFVLAPGEAAGSWMLNNANIVQTDIVGTNGVIHVIDSVILPSNIVQLLSYHPSFSTLVVAAIEAELDTALAEDTFTVFAPTDDAFGDLLEDLDASAEDLLGREDLGDILLYHAIGAEVAAEDVETSFAEMASGLSATLSPGAATGSWRINDALITQVDVKATNGYIHVIDTVLLPASIAGLLSFHPDFSTVVAAAGEAELVGTLAGDGSLTLFAPDNDAFAALLTELDATAEELLAREDLADILLYHVLGAEVPASAVATSFQTTASGLSFTLSPGTGAGTWKVNAANIVETDIFASNGVIHLIDGVLLPADIVDLLIWNPNFSTLVTAVSTAGLVGALRGDDLTVFAPTNTAFSNYLAGAGLTVEDLLGLTSLSRILSYHVFAGVAFAENLVNGNITMLSGDPATVALGTPSTIDGAAIQSVDHEGTNGVIHTLGGVMTPPTQPIVVAE